jgi:hypothetical protein
MVKWRGWKAVIRDVVIIYIFTGIGGVLIGIVAGSQPPTTALGFANILLGSIGFCLVGCMTDNKRWQHLTIVAVFVWLTSILNAIFLPFSFTHWLFGLVINFIIMAIGGGLSFLFVKPKHG